MATVGEIVRVTLHYNILNTSDVLNVFHYEIQGADADDTEIGNIINGWVTTEWGPTWENMASVNASISQVDISIVDLAGLVVRVIGTIAYTIPGTEAASVVSAAVSAYMLLRTIIPKVRGSKYVPGLAESVVTDGELDPSALATLALLILDYVAILSGVGQTILVPGIPSKFTNQFEEFLIGGLIEGIPAYQRRRKPQVGS